MKGVSSRDPVFARWRDGGLVWLPERGMGYYPVAETPYDGEYFEKYVEYAETPMGQELDRTRVGLVTRHSPPGTRVVDVGIGCGAFVDALRPHRETYGYDVNPAGVEWLEARGLLVDPFETVVDAVTFWDVIEHIPDVHRLLENVQQWVFASLPIFTGPDHVLRSKHFRKDEHCWYWTRDGFIGWMAEHGFECVEHGTPESIAGREDIHSFALRRVTG